MKKLFLMLCSAIVLSSCAGLTEISTPQSVALNTGNFKFVKSVNASTQATYFLSIGGMSESATADVVDKLITEADLHPNQALADIRIKTTCKYYLGFIFVRRITTASASVVEFLPATQVTSNNASYDIPQATGNDITQIVETTVVTDDVDSQDQAEPASHKPLLSRLKEKLAQSKENSSADATSEEADKDTQVQSKPVNHREMLARIREINDSLTKGTYGDLDAIQAELDKIIAWYAENGHRSVDEKMEIKKAQSLIIRQQIK